MNAPLEGLRVVDCSSGLAGPRATGLLADYGADVLWVEPSGGDPLRQVLRTEYAVFNRGKRSAELDLHAEADRAVLLDHIRAADVVVIDRTQQAAEEVGLDWATVHAEAPGVVYCAISGFGEDGTLADVPGYEAIVQAYVGVTAEQSGHRPAPIYEGLPFASIGASYLALIGILGALYRRGIDGVGRRVDTSMVDGSLAYLGMVWGDSDQVSAAPPIQPGRIRLVSRSFRCADDEYLGIHTAAVGAFGRLIRALGLQDRIPVREDGTDMQYPLNDEERKIILEELPEIFETQPRQVWLDRLLAADVCAIPELHPGQVFDEPQVRHNDMVVEVDDPDLGRLEQVAPPAKFRDMAAVVRSGAPTVGQHTAAVRAERAVSTARGSSESTVVEDVPLLDGVRILDLGAYYAGPFSSRLLADLGADVIKLETTVGDQLRGIARPFRSAQAGKRGISLNLKDPDLAEARAALIGWADVICHNMRPGAADRVGLGYEQVAAANPGAVYLYAPGWGSSGPDAGRQAFAPMVSGYVGVGYEVAGRFNPPMWPLGNEDPGNGLLGAVAILMGLLARQRRGTGCYVENPQINATMTHLAHVVRRPDGEVLGAERLDPLQMGIGPLDRLYETSDGWLCVVAATEDEVRRLGKVLGIDIVDDTRFSSHDARLENEDELAYLLSDVIAGRTTQELLDALRAEGVAAMEPKVENNNAAFHRDPVNQAIGRIAEVDTERHGRVREPANLVRVSDAKRVPHRVAPELGEHTDEVLRDLGYDDVRIAGLRERGSIR